MAASGALSAARTFVRAIVEHGGFNTLMRNVEVTSACRGKCVCEMKVAEEHMNTQGTMHGGFTASLIDWSTTMAVMLAERPPGVSVDMNISYMKAARLGDTLEITAECLKHGKTLAFTSADIINKSDGSLIATGRHTKHLGT